jgi:hypothetical protein
MKEIKEGKADLMADLHALVSFCECRLHNYIFCLEQWPQIGNFVPNFAGD